MNGVFLVIPLLWIRYGLLSLANKNALQRAALFPPMRGVERVMYWIYQASTVAIIVLMLTANVSAGTPGLLVGAAVYLLGILLLSISTVNFAKPGETGINQNGLYRFSRNPMYVAYFVYFLGCVLLTRSIALFALLCVFQVSAHWIILSEERWCVEHFGNAYIRYMQRVRRYV